MPDIPPPTFEDMALNPQYSYTFMIQCVHPVYRADVEIINSWIRRANAAEQRVRKLELALLAIIQNRLDDNGLCPFVATGASCGCSECVARFALSEKNS